MSFKTLYPLINNSLFEDIISKNKQTQVIIDDFTLASAIGKGENYGSNMLRAIVNYSTNDKNSKQSIKFIIKIETTNEKAAQLVRDIGAFEKEVTIYKDILPEVEKLLKKIGYNKKLSPM